MLQHWFVLSIPAAATPSTAALSCCPRLLLPSPAAALAPPTAPTPPTAVLAFCSPRLLPPYFALTSHLPFLLLMLIDSALLATPVHALIRSLIPQSVAAASGPPYAASKQEQGRQEAA